MEPHDRHTKQLAEALMGAAAEIQLRERSIDEIEKEATRRSRRLWQRIISGPGHDGG